MGWVNLGKNEIAGGLTSHGRTCFNKLLPAETVLKASLPTDANYREKIGQGAFGTGTAGAVLLACSARFQAASCSFAKGVTISLGFSTGVPVLRESRARILGEGVT